MLEGLAAWILNTYLGEYVENLNTDQLTIGLFRGLVNLENLPLKKSAFKNLGLPFEIKSGFIGHISFQIPIHRLASEQWILKIDTIKIVAIPSLHHEYSLDEEKQLQERKNLMLIELENYFYSQIKNLQNISTTQNTWWNYGVSFLSSIIEKLQLKVSNISIEYEDDAQLLDIPINCGIRIDNISVDNCDRNWTPSYLSHSSDNLVYKIICLDSVSIFCNSGCVIEEDKENVTESKKNYIISPLNICAHLQRDITLTPLKKKDKPRIFIEFELETFPITIDDQIIKTLSLISNRIDRIRISAPFRKYRPSVSLHGNCKKWWLFAINSILIPLKENNTRNSSSYMSKRCRNNVRYVEIYTYYLINNSQYLHSEDKDFIMTFQEQSSYEEILILRNIVMANLLEKESLKLIKPFEENNKISDGPVSSKGLLQRWFPSWGGWYDPKDHNKITVENSSHVDPINEVGEINQIANIAVEKLVVEEKNHLLNDDDISQAIADTLNDNTLQMLDSVFVKINLKIKSGACFINYVSSKNVVEALAHLECDRVEINLELRSRCGGWMTSFAINDFKITDKSTINSLKPTICSMLKKDDNTDNLLYISLEKKPFNIKADYKLSISSQPLELVYNVKFVQTFYDIFILPIKRNNFEFKENMAPSAIKNMKNFDDKFDKIFANSVQSFPRWALDIDLYAPQILIYENVTKSLSAILLFNLGHFTMKNNRNFTTNANSIYDEEPENDEEDEFITPCSSPTAKPSIIYEENIQTSIPSLPHNLTQIFYETYSLNISEMKISSGRGNTCNLKNITQNILDNFSLSFDVQRRLLVIADIPYFNIATKIPSIEFHIDEIKLADAQNCLKPFFRLINLKENSRNKNIKFVSQQNKQAKNMNHLDYTLSKKKKVPTATLR